MRADRMYHSIRLLLCRTGVKRANYLKKHDLLGGIGENCSWGPWRLPLYSKLIILHNNVRVHKKAVFMTHDLLNRFLATCYPDKDFGQRERIGCIEVMDNAYVAIRVHIMPNVRIGNNCLITAGSIVTSDIPDNSIASGNPAKPVGRFDMFAALRAMGKSQTQRFKNQELPDEIAKEEWEKFRQRHNK